jgi:hypothetical protein
MYSKQTKRAIANYGESACVKAARMNECGYGARSIAEQGPETITTTQQADAAINAGREIQKRKGIR